MLCLCHKGALDCVTKTFNSLPKSWKICLVNQNQLQVCTYTGNYLYNRVLLMAVVLCRGRTLHIHKSDDSNSPFQDVGLSELDDPFDSNNDTDIDVDNVDIREYGTENNDPGPADNISKDELDDSDDASSGSILLIVLYDQGTFLDNIDGSDLIRYRSNVTSHSLVLTKCKCFNNR